jgi:putative phage-type endonuclease
MIIIPQSDTDAWTAARIGKVTASRIADVMATTRTGPAASRANYAAELVAERLTGRPAERFINAAMQHGIDTEADAVAAYEWERAHAATPGGFVSHPSIDMAGASPDRFVGSSGLLEVKCPLTATHIARLLGEDIPRKYILQMQWQMACTGRAWCDYASFDPRLSGDLQLHVERVARDDALISEIEEAVSMFLRHVDDTVQRLRSIGK